MTLHLTRSTRSLVGTFLVVLAGFAGFGCGAPPSGPQVEIVTNMGTIRAQLYESDAPKTVKNFLGYVDKKHYDGTIFHRVIPDFMIQGGGFRPNLQQILGNDVEGIKNESYNGHRNDRGTLAMARTSAPDSATDQFYINLKDNKDLDRAYAKDGVGYAVFGKVTDGMDVVDRIAAVSTVTRVGHEKVPLTPVIIETIRRLPEKK